MMLQRLGQQQEALLQQQEQLQQAREQQRAEHLAIELEAAAAATTLENVHAAGTAQAAELQVARHTGTCGIYRGR